jgi:hypothetical protein
VGGHSASSVGCITGAMWTYKLWEGEGEYYSLDKPRAVPLWARLWACAGLRVGTRGVTRGGLTNEPPLATGGSSRD